MRANEFIVEVTADDLEQWNPERFQTQQEGDPIGAISDKQAFSSNLPSCLDMPIKLPGTSIKNPYKNKGVVEFVQRALQHNQKVNPRFDQSYIYLTVDQRMVEGNKTHRRGGAHFDGMQGERYKIKLPMDQNYIVSDYNPTHLFNQPFDARGLSTKHHNWFHELEKQVDKSRTFVPDPYVIYFVSGYHMHESPIAPETKMRTFMRISVGYKPGGLPNETPNPLLPTPRLNRDREIPANLQKDLKIGTAPDPTKVIGSEIDEGWKEKAKGLAAAGAIALGGQAIMPKTIEPSPYSASQYQLPRVPQEILQKVNAVIHSPLALALRREAYIAGLEGAELAQFIAQCAHETQNFMSLKEYGGSLDFRQYDIRYNPQKAKILGNTKPGDGARYHGRGFIQLTGRYNYKKAGEALGLPLEARPELVERPDVAAKVAVWYWQNRVAPKVDNFKDTRAVTKPINSGLNGLKDREDKFNAVMQILSAPRTR